ncbi:TPA: DUF2975 domain-containing protein [Listeria monocytogenes]|nr:DUF2975 domain-containing protein [Listeria monocytogenes]EGJ5774483.1 DUF2975 domain-containing protein [Listeria monocytogenes]EKZ1157063.1 DUF2975 domain-containing protein [Listeria monocytogenes]EKZ1159932.1 DUF2975 domain-containing protein [Listeria monocytogenes]EKZ1165603.1 DUF2975 domain-containing protein [Listeria monocytogenes]
MKLKRLQKMSYFLHIALKILSISSVIMAIIAVLMKLFSSKNVMINKLESDTIFYFQTELFVGENNLPYVETEEWILVGVAVFSSMILAYLLWTASMIFKDLAANFTPFNDITVSRLRRIAVLMIIYALVPQIIYSILHTVLIPGYSINLGLNMSFFFALIFYCLTEIFRYGVSLQKESDETL